MSDPSIARPRRNRYPVAVHLFFVQDGRVLLSRRYNTGWEDGKYSVPAGHVERGESVTQTAVREARDEVGAELTPVDLSVVHVMHRQSDEERVDFFLEVHGWWGAITNAEPEKCDDLYWALPDTLPANTIPYVRHALQCWQDGVPYSEFGW